MDLRLYVREDCHLCEQFELELALDLGGDRPALTVLDVDRDAELAARYGLRVPVLEADGRVICEGRYDRDRVQRALRL